MKARLGIFLVLLGLWLAVIAVRLFDLQVLRHDHYLERAQRQQQRVVELHPPRGTIYDRAGQKLAVSVQVRSAYAVPSQVEDPDATAQALTTVLGGDWRELARSLRKDREFVWIARKLDDPVAERVRTLELPGVDFLEEAKRYYPNGPLAASVLGYVGTDNVGLGGVEAVYDEDVAGVSGQQTVLRDARRGTAVTPLMTRQPPQPGADLHLTLDATLQHVAERELARQMEKHNAKGGTFVALDPRTGAVLAMVSLPGFDPNHFTEYGPERWRNATVMDAYEPGSTFKMVTVAAGLEAGLIDPADRFDCEMGGYTVQGIRMRDHKPFGVLSVREILQKSSNVGAMKIGLLAGPERLRNQTLALGFGRALGVDLPGESPGQVQQGGTWRPLTTANIAFGQGLSVTPLQLANAFGAVANGGRVLRPYVVATVDDAGRRSDRAGTVELGRAMSEATARSLERMLEAVVESGTGRAAAIPGYRVAGKTGTAQKAVPGLGYRGGHYVASFAGFAPARDPRIVAVVALDEPRAGGYHGGQVAAPVFGAVVAEALRILGVPPEWPQPDEQPPGQPGRSPRRGAPEPPADAQEGWSRELPSRVALREGMADGLPDFSGLTAREALVRASALGLEVRLLGEGGFVARQEPAAAAAPPAGAAPVTLWLAERSTRG